MVTVKKGNVELNIDETEVSRFLAKGYDQIGSRGEIVKEATGGKTVSIEEYNRLIAENAELKKKLAEKPTKKKSTVEAGTEAGTETAPE